MKCLDGYPPVISRFFCYITPAPKHNVVPGFEPLEPVVAGSEFLNFPFVVAGSNFRFHCFPKPYLWDFASRCSSQLELSN